MNEKKKAGSNDTFDKLSSAFGTSFDGEEVEVSETEKKLESLKKKKNELVSTDITSLSLEDAEYMEMEIKTCLGGIEMVMNKLEQDIKVGSAPRMFEVYATLANSKLSGVKELRELQKTILDTKMKLKEGGPVGGKGTTNVNIKMDGNALSKLLDQASKKSSMNAIEAEFDVEDEEPNRK